MTLNQLKIFLAIAEVGNVTKAADLLGITQSAASASIASIENIYQVKLFERVGRSIILSEVGKRFLPEAQSAIASAKSASKYLRSLSEKTVGTLKIAASQTIANYWLPRKLALFHARHPEVALHLTMTNTSAVEKAVVNGKVDIGFVEAEVFSDELRFIKVDHDQIALVASVSRWASLGLSDNLNNISKLPWIVREKGSGTRKVLEDLMIQNKISWSDLDIVLELPSNESVREAVIAGVGVTLISRHVVSLALETGLLKATSLSLPPRNYQMVVKKNRSFRMEENALIGMIKGQIAT
jgi:DNA-binding transcriptional LysR family regulator